MKNKSPFCFVSLFLLAAVSLVSAEVHQAEQYIIDHQGIVFNGYFIGGCDAGDWIRYEPVDLQHGAVNITFNLARDGGGITGGAIEIRLDSHTGTLLGTHNVVGTGGWTTFRTQSTALNGRGGDGSPRSIVLVFKNISGVANIDWFEIETRTVPPLFIYGVDWDNASDVCEVYSPTTGITSLGCCDPNDWVMYENIDMKEGATHFVTDISHEGTGYSGDIELRLDSPNGPLLGIHAVQGTGDWENFTLVSEQLKGTTIPGAGGVHDLYFVFKGNHHGIVNIHSFELTVKEPYVLHIEAEHYNAQSGINHNGWFIGGCDNNNWVRYDDLNLQYGAYYLKARLASSSKNYKGHVELRANDKDTGPIIGTMRVLGTDGWGNFLFRDAELDGHHLPDARGENIDLYLVFRGTHGVCNIDWFELSLKQEPCMDLVSLDGYMEDVVIEKDHLNQVSHFYQNLTTPNGSEGRVDFTDAGSPPRRFYLTDHLGSTRAVINGSGTVMEGYLYTAYGEMESLMETVEDSKERFSGKEFDREGAVDGVTGGIGLNYFGARYYDAAVGYWTSRDPMNQFWSGYSYVGNGRNPLSSVDPDGNENLLVFYQNQQRLSQWAEENREVANQTALTTTDIGVGFIPVVGDVKDWQEVATGKNLLTGENLSAGQRLLTAGAGLLPAVGGALVRKVFGGLADLLRGGRKATKEAVETAAESGTKKVAKQSNVNVAGKKVTEPDGGFSADLSKTKAKTRSGHRNAGNKQLNEKMKNDPQFRSEMESRHGTDVLDRTSTSNGGRRNPSNTEWDHNTQNPNQLDLRTKPNHAKKTKTEGRSGGGWKKFHKD